MACPTVPPLEKFKYQLVKVEKGEEMFVAAARTQLSEEEKSNLAKVVKIAAIKLSVYVHSQKLLYQVFYYAFLKAFFHHMHQKVKYDVTILQNVITS